MMQSSATFKREDELEQLRKDQPFPPKAKRLAMIFSLALLALMCLPLIIELTSAPVMIGPWLTLAISLPITLVALMFMGFLRDGLTANLISGGALLLAAQISFGVSSNPESLESGRILLIRSIGPVLTLIVLGYFWLSLKTHLRDIHYMVAQGESMQDIMTRMQQAQVIKKSGGEPVLDDKGRVVDKNDLIPRKGFRPKKGLSAKATGGKKKRKKPKVR